MPDKIHFRKLKKIGRLFYKIEGDIVTRILLKEYSAEISVSRNKMTIEHAKTHEDFEDCTEAEFRSAHADALEICTLLKIV